MSARPDVIDHVARVLIVDDDETSRQLIGVMLAAENLVLLEAGTGEEALALVAQRAPDLILLDVMLPGMDGYQVATTLKAIAATRNIPIIMITALGTTDAKLLGLNAGAEEFLTTPVDRSELCVRVRNLLRLKAYGDYYDNYSHMLEREVHTRTAAVVASEELYRSTFDAAPVGIVHVGLDGAWVRVNQRLCDLLGYSREELQSPAVRARMKLDESPGEEESFRAMVAGTLDRHTIEEKRYVRRDGTSLWARVNVSVHRDALGQSQHFISIIEDVTERRTFEAQIRQATKMDAVGKLASGVAHDFNNLLTVILGYAEMMVAADAVAGRHESDLKELISAARSATGLTKQLLAFSREQVLHAEPLDVNALITDMSGMLRRLIGENIEVSLKLAPDLTAALADRGQIEQVIMNLVVNARDAMPTGGNITIETGDVDLENSAFHLETVVAGRYVMLAITDTGTGMTAETQRRLFEPFFTTKEPGKGTGLGLSTTYGIVKQSKGYVWVYSELALGTTFKVYLPHADEQVAPPRLRVDAAPVPQGPGTVLLVEDEPSVRHLAKRMLNDAGYRVLEAIDGDDAESVFAANAGGIDLVVTDMVMPGSGGPALVSRLKARVPALRALYMSGYTEQSTAHAAWLHQGVPFVQKPFTASEFVRQVRSALLS